MVVSKGNQAVGPSQAAKGREQAKGTVQCISINKSKDILSVNEGL